MRKNLALNKAEKKALKKKVAERCSPLKVRVEELDGIFSEPGEECYFMVKGAGLDDHIRANSLFTKHGHILDFIKRKARMGQQITVDDAIKLLDDPIISKLHPNTAFEIDLFKRMVAKPEFTLEEVFDLSYSYPEVINRVCSFAMERTQGK